MPDVRRPRQSAVDAQLVGKRHANLTFALTYRAAPLALYISKSYSLAVLLALWGLGPTRASHMVACAVLCTVLVKPYSNHFAEQWPVPYAPVLYSD